LADDGQLNVSTKIDGAPAVVCFSKFEGYPDNSICLKSFLTSNKSCMSTPQEIEEKYGDRPDMATKLVNCLKLAKCIPSGEAWQGDCLFTQEDLMTTEIDGQEYLVFQPNKIVYAFSEDNPTYETIKNSDFGICFHTIYKGNLESKSQSFRVDASRLSNVPDGIYVMSPVLNAPKDKSAYSTDEIIKKYDALKTVEGKLLSNNSFEELCNNKAFKSYWDLFENANLSDKQATTINLSTFYGDLLDFIHSRMKKEYDKKVAGLKTEKGKESATEKYNQSLVELDLLLDKNKSIITNMVAALNLVADIKMLMWGGFKQSKQDYKTFYNTKSRGYIPADMEGVAMSDQDGNIVKIVDRSTFSHANRSDDYISGFQHESLEEGSKDSMYTFDDFLDDEFEIKVGDKSLGKVKGKDFSKDKDPRDVEDE